MLEDVRYIEETKVTVRKYRHRTTVPSKIFKLPKLKDGDSLRWIAMKDGKILIEKSPQNDKTTIDSNFLLCTHKILINLVTRKRVHVMKELLSES